MARNGLTWPEMSRNYWKLLKITGNGYKLI